VGAVQSALGVGGRGREVLVLVTCPLQFAKAGSAATLPQQEKNNSDVQRDRAYITGFISAVASYPSWRCTFGDFESLAVASRRARQC
jgi:hypothetical protein